MTKSGEFPSFLGGTAMFDVLRPEVIRANYGKAMDQFRELSLAWLGAVNKTVEASWTLAAQLPRCADPSDASLVCTTWFEERRAAILADSKTVAELWLKVCRADAALPMVVTLRSSDAAQSVSAAE